MSERTTFSVWWSATRFSAAYANFLRSETTSVSPQADNPRGYGRARRCSFGLPTTNEQNVPTKANQLANFPLNFLRTGFYSFINGNIGDRTAYGLLWSATSSIESSANNLKTDTRDVAPRLNASRGAGYALRWGADVFWDGK